MAADSGGTSGLVPHARLILLRRAPLSQINALIVAGQWWRLLTPAFLHGNLMHLVVNSYSLNNLGPTVERTAGWAGRERSPSDRLQPAQRQAGQPWGQEREHTRWGILRVPWGRRRAALRALLPTRSAQSPLEPCIDRTMHEGWLPHTHPATRCQRHPLSLPPAAPAASCSCTWRRPWRATWPPSTAARRPRWAPLAPSSASAAPWPCTSTATSGTRSCMGGEGG